MVMDMIRTFVSKLLHKVLSEKSIERIRIYRFGMKLRRFFLYRGKKVLLLGTPNHGNLGDHAIAFAIRKLLFDKNDKIRIFEIVHYDFDYYSDYLSRFINKHHLYHVAILINGGGSMGVEWFSFEKLIRDVITMFPKNRIVIFPQTIYYGSTEEGIKEFETSKALYATHNDLHICAREKVSYSIMKDAYPFADILLAPDIALYLDFQNPKLKRDGILICLRSDVESRLSAEERQAIIEMADNSICTDTVLRLQIPQNKREFFINQKLDEFKKARLVITDRLHGMIFCAITATPCIVLSNYNHKVKGVYEWLRPYDYIQYLDDVQDLPQNIDRLLQIKDNVYSNKEFIPYFDKINSLI